MKAEVKQLQGISLVGKADSGHWVPMDGGEMFGGSKAAAGPMELVLMALAGCTSMDVIPILNKKKLQIEDYKVEVEAERAETHPKVFTKINLNYIFWGKDISTEAVEKAINLSKDKYCSVSAMLEKSVDISFTYEIRDSQTN